MTRRNEVLVGLAIVLGAAVVVGGTLWLQGFQWRANTRIVEARFREVGQLLEGNAVKLRGVSIGRVESIDIEPGGGAVRVRMRIRRGVELPEDAVVLLAPESLFGDWQAEILPRSRYPHFDYLEPEGGGVLPGYSLPDFSRLTAAADRISDNLAVLSDRVELAFTEETAENIRRAIENISEVSDKLTGLVEQQARTVQELASALGETTGEVGEAAEAAQRTFATIDRALAGGTLDTVVVSARTAAENLARLTERLDAALGELRGTVMAVDSAFTRLDRIAARVEAGEGGLGRLFGDTALYVRARETLAELNRLLADFQRNPRRYIKLSIF